MMPGYYPDTAWPANYFDDNYWPDYGAVTAVTFLAAISLNGEFYITQAVAGEWDITKSIDGEFYTTHTIEGEI